MQPELLSTHHVIVQTSRSLITMVMVFTFWWTYQFFVLCVEPMFVWPQQILARAAAAAVESAKVLAYGDVGQHRVVPFVLEEFGLMGPATKRFFADCTRIRGDRLDVEGRSATWSARSWSSFWQQRLCLALTRGIVDCMLRRAQADFQGQ